MENAKCLKEVNLPFQFQSVAYLKIYFFSSRNRDEVDIAENSSSAEVLNSGDQPLTLEQVKKRVTRRLQRLDAVQRGKVSGKTTPTPAPAKTPQPQEAHKDEGSSVASS